jgi:tetrapyrrole methylase family protein / MazG family protein
MINKDSKVYVKKGKDEKKDFNDLINLVETLRGKNGCPWDMEQTHKSIKNELLEETYELIEAIENNDVNGMVEELGDVLFHVMFHCSIGQEAGKFSISDVIENIINKMIYRHPHVFGRDSVTDSKEVLEKWDDLKKTEKSYETITDEMKAVANTLPSLIKAHKIQKKAEKVGFDWDNVEDAAEKVKEELIEVLDVYKSNNKEKIKNEVGDLLFACVNVARKLDINGEEAVNSTIKKFIQRFSYIEESLIEKGKKFNDVSLEDMDKLWVKAKNIENK